MFTHTDRTRRDTFANSKPGKVRRDDRRKRLAEKSAFLRDGLTIRAGE
ncbi:hypothetical protein [Hoeflea sp.]